MLLRFLPGLDCPAAFLICSRNVPDIIYSIPWCHGFGYLASWFLRMLPPSPSRVTQEAKRLRSRMWLADYRPLWRRGIRVRFGNPQTGPLTISFFSNLAALTLDLATAGGPNTLDFEALENGSLVGSATLLSSVPGGHYNGEGFVSSNGTFDQVTLTSSALLALDNVDATPSSAVPEPAVAGLILVGLMISRIVARLA